MYQLSKNTVNALNRVKSIYACTYYMYVSIYLFIQFEFYYFISFDTLYLSGYEHIFMGLRFMATAACQTIHEVPHKLEHRYINLVIRSFHFSFELIDRSLLFDIALEAFYLS